MDIMDFPSGEMSSLIWFIPRLHKSLVLFCARISGFWVVGMLSPVWVGESHGRSGMVYVC